MQRFIQGPRLSRFIAPFLSLEDEVGRLFKLMRMGVGGGGGEVVAFKQGCLKSSGTLPLFFSPPFFFLRIGLTVEIILTAKKLFKIAIRETSRTAGLAVCKSRIYNFIL